MSTTTIVSNSATILQESGRMVLTILSSNTAAGVLAEKTQQALDAIDSAADTAMFTAGMYPDTATGLINTVDGDYFSIPSPEADEFSILYQNVSGSAVEKKRFGTAAMSQAAINAAAVAEAAADFAFDTVQGIADVAIYNTKAEANAAASGLADQALVMVLVDESLAGIKSLYRKESGSLVFKQELLTKDVVDAAVVDAEAAKTAAESARDAAFINADVYADTTAGLAAVADGEQFQVVSGSEIIRYTRTNSTTATEVARYPSAAYIWYMESAKRAASIGKNRFNPSDHNVAAGYAINSATGALTATAGFNATGYIPVTAGATYTMSVGRSYAWYNGNRTFISGGAGTGLAQTVTAPAGAVYFRTGVSDSTLSTFQFESGSSSTAYKAYTEEPALQGDVVTTNSILRLAVTPERASFISAGKNKFNKDAATIGQYITSAGVMSANATYDLSDYIEVVVGASYKSSHNIRFSCYYDANMNVVAGGITADTTTFTVPVGVTFVRVSMYHANLAAFQLEAGTTATAYESFRWVNELTAPVADGSIDSDALAAGAVTPTKSTFFNASRNLFDKSAALLGYYLSNAGSLAASAAYEVSDYIPITPGSTYYLSPSDGVRFTCYFDAALNVVAGGSSTANVPSFTAPVGAVWVRITIFQTAHDTFQFELGSKTGFMPFGPRLKTELLAAPEMVIPPYVFGVQGRECNVYLDNLHIADASDYLHDVTSESSVGQHQSERWTWTPAAALASGALTVAAHEKLSGTLLTTKTAQLRAAASSAGTGTTKKVLVIGDSLVNAGTITQTLIDIAAGDVMGVTMLGTRGTGPNYHEGRGGWTISNYTSNYSDGTYGANPFWIGGAVNVPQYLIDNSVATPDWVFIHLGINDVFSQTTDSGASAAADAAFTNLDTLITSIKAAGAGVKVGLMLPSPPSSDEDAFGFSYATGQTKWRFKRNILIWARQLIAKYSGQEASRIYVVPTNTALDTVNNMSRAASAPVNSRSSVNVARQNNGVHPAASGYQQIGDALWAFLKYYA